MDVYEAINKRRSIRSFDKIKDISENIIQKLLEAACQAPSAGNIQPWRFLIIRDRNLKEKLVEAAFGQHFVAEAPVVIVVSADLRAMSSSYGTRGTTVYALQDTAAAIENLLLAAWAEDLGACWVGAFDERRASVSLNLPPHYRPLAIIPLGYPDMVPTKPTRKSALSLTEFR